MVLTLLCSAVVVALGLAVAVCGSSGALLTVQAHTMAPRTMAVNRMVVSNAAGRTRVSGGGMAGSISHCPHVARLEGPGRAHREQIRIAVGRADALVFGADRQSPESILNTGTIGESSVPDALRHITGGVD